MPVTQKPHECGWFYHAPAKKTVNAERLDVPAPSQIPGIGYDDPSLLEKEEVRPMMFKETDSKYIQMAKMGGRKDLLSFNPDRYRKKQSNPSGYHRNEWFYLEDNRLEDEDKKEKQSWEFLLPEYMVHKGYQPSFENPATPPSRGPNSSAPYHTEKGSMLEREGRSATDKTVKIPEARKIGYGVRNEKPPAKHAELERVPDHKRRGKKTMVTSNLQMEQQDPTMMSKLLAGGYEKDWHEKHAAAQPHQGGDMSGVQTTQESSSVEKNCQKQSAPQYVVVKKPGEQEKKDMFKMARFKNIPSKIDSHQSMDVLSHYK